MNLNLREEENLSTAGICIDPQYEILMFLSVVPYCYFYLYHAEPQPRRGYCRDQENVSIGIVSNSVWNCIDVIVSCTIHNILSVQFPCHQ